MSLEFHEKALDYHRQGRPGKITVSSIKNLNSEEDLSLAYSPELQHLLEKSLRFQIL